jgi:hypothetical protein
MSDFPVNPSLDDVQRWMQGGETETVEFLGLIPSVLRLSQILAGFANGRGGVILLGVQESPTRITGITWQQLGAIFDRATMQLNPGANATLHQVQMPDGKTVGVIVVPRSQAIVLTQAGAFIRRGTRTEPMKADEIQTKLPPSDPHAFAESLSSLTTLVIVLNGKVEHGQTIRGQLKGLLIGAILGVVLGAPVGYYINIAASYRYAEMTKQKQSAAPPSIENRSASTTVTTTEAPASTSPSTPPPTSEPTIKTQATTTATRPATRPKPKSSGGTNK